MSYTKTDRRRAISHKNYRTYTKEFKLEALELLKDSGKSASRVERELGITPGLLGKWRDQYPVTSTDMPEAVLEPSDLEAAKTEIRRLKRELAIVAEERNTLKKAVNIFSRGNA